MVACLEVLRATLAENRTMSQMLELCANCSTYSVQGVFEAESHSIYSQITSATHT